jgi:hypothetical protein
MSGVYCGGCGEGNLLPELSGKGADPVVCDLCAWKADASLLPQRRIADDAAPWTKRQRKEEGRLFFLWLLFDHEEPEVAFSIMKVLGLREMHTSASSLMELGKKPTEEQLRKLAAIPGVHGVRLAP